MNTDTPSQTPPYRNPDLPVEHRVADLLGRMTLDEKLAERDALQKEKEITANRLDRAGRLIAGLGGERARWEAAVADLDRDQRLSRDEFDAFQEDPEEEEAEE